MIRKLSLMVLVWLCAEGAFSQTTIPDTPAGHVLSAWLDAFNSGDRMKIDSFAKSYDPLHAESIATSAQFRGRSGGVELVAIDRSEPLTILFRGKEKTQPILLLGKIELTASDARTIQNFNLRALPPGTVSDNIKLDAGLRKQAIDDVITNLNQYYVYPEMAAKMAAGLQAHEQKGDYNSITDGDVFAGVITTHLLDVSHDKHVHVFFNPYKLPTEPPNVTPEQMAESRRAMAKDCGFRKVDILPNNIGYLKFDYFADPMACGRTAGAAMVFFANVDAVIFDLRDNTGGDPRMVAFMCTYLFEQPTHLDDIYERKANKTTENWTMRFVPGSRLGQKPVYILTSSRTFSGAEEFAYDLKNLKRAKIVGEQSSGGSHPVNAFNAGDHFTIFVPGARTVNFISKTDWEGTGVTPDVVAKSEDALETAERLAAQEIQESANRAGGGVRVD
jgi:retinol-binding protein 3